MRNLGKTLSLALVLLMLTVGAFFVVPVPATSAWTIQTISNSAGSISAIALDSNNYPHIAYTEFVYGISSSWTSRGTYYVVYASWNGSMWLNQTVAAEGALYDLALDSHNNAHILYKSLGVNSGALMYAHWTGDGWSTQTIDTEGGEGSIALDSSDIPHIAYIASGDSTSRSYLKYTSWTGSSWSKETVDGVDLGYFVGLKMDSQNHPHVMYESETVYSNGSSSEVLKYATFDNASEWTTQTVGQNIECRNMVLDANGSPHFAYKTSYTSWNGSAWSNQSFSSKFNSSVFFGDSYLSLDKQNNPSIALELTSGSPVLMYIHWTGTEWATQAIDSNSENSGPIAIDPNGNPHMCYFSASGSVSSMPLFSLMYATTNLSTQTTQPAQNSTSPSLIGVLVAIPVIVILVVLALVYRSKKKPR
jgi:hypothetical protein